MIRIGSAGWSYPDWEGIVYPARRDRDFDQLATLAAFLDCVEINVSFYRIPSPRFVASWVKRTAPFKSFLFTAKLWRGFTHELGIGPEESSEAEAAFRESMKPLLDAGRLGALLIQFPYSFHNDASSRRRLAEVLERFGDFRNVVEVRHSSWLTDEFFRYLRKEGVAFCNVDQPAVSSNIPPTSHVTAPIAYVRLHGRNAGAWFEEGAGRDDRYNYLYAAEELTGWVDRIATLASKAKDVIVIANNHYRAQGVANALELKSMIEGSKVKAPPEILRTYPRLSANATPVPWPARGTAASSQGRLPFPRSGIDDR